MSQTQASKDLDSDKPISLQLPKKGEEVDPEQYVKLLNHYVKDVRKVEADEKERQRMMLLEQTYTYTFLDIIFPYHMYIGKLEQENFDRMKEEKKQKRLEQKQKEQPQNSSNSESVSKVEKPSASQEYNKLTSGLENYYQYTTLKIFKRRRMYLTWLFYEKFDKMLTPEEKDRRDFAEHTMFKYNVGFKLLSITTFLYVLSRRRHANPSYLYDGLLIYTGSYFFLLSYVYGIYKAWPSYYDLAHKVVKSKQKIGVDDNIMLDDFKLKYYKYDLAFQSLL
eukprot:403353495